MHVDQRYLDGLLAGDSATVREIYDRFSPGIRRYILQNQGGDSDAADIFQEALIDIYRQARHKQLVLTCPFEPFLLLVCKRKWLNEIKKRRRGTVTKDPDELSEFAEDVFELAENLARDEERARLFLEQFRRLGQKCREIIRLTLGGGKQEEVASRLGVTYGYLRKKKSECLATLLSFVEEAQKKHHGDLR